MNSITKKNNKEFIERACKVLLELGAKKVENKLSNFRSFKLNTIVGELEINVRTDNFACYTVFATFKDAEKAKQKFNCNPHSGKYNIHPTGTADMDDVIDCVRNHFKATL